MFRSFVAALVPYAVLARGDNDGTSYENAYNVEMIGNEGDGVWTDVNTWNELSDDGVTRELHGETIAFVKN